MKARTGNLLDKAQDAIEAAELLLKGSKNSIAAGRAYYAMFYVAEALLCEKGLEFSKHQGVHAAFGLHFVKAGEMDAKFHRRMLEAFASRIEADYGVGNPPHIETVNELINHANEFLIEARRYLAKHA